MIPASPDEFFDRSRPLPLPRPLRLIGRRRLRRADDDGAFELRLGLAAVAGFFGLFLGWAAFAPLDAATHAEGSVTVAGSRQVVQHKDGGTVSALHVREGQHVRRGQVLVELAPTELAAAERALTQQVIDLQAQTARLDAEATGAAALVVPAAYAALDAPDRALAAAALDRQRAELAAQRHAATVQKRQLGRQAAQLDARIGGIGEQIASTRRQSQLFEDQLGGMRQLVSKGFASANRVRELERAREALGSDASGLAAAAASARQQIGETRLQSASIDAGRLREALEQRRLVQASLTDLLPRLGAVRAQLEATRIRATASGQVVGLEGATVGAVVAPGQTLMEIVPDAARLVLTAKIAPGDADDVHLGQPAEVRLSGMHDRSLPVLLGTVTRVSADSFEDKRTGQSFYTAEVVVPDARLAEVARRHGARALLRPGMPVELLVPQRSRTFLQYLLEPLDRALWVGLHEK